LNIYYYCYSDDGACKKQVHIKKSEQYYMLPQAITLPNEKLLTDVIFLDEIEFQGLSNEEVVREASKMLKCMEGERIYFEKCSSLQLLTLKTTEGRCLDHRDVLLFVCSLGQRFKDWVVPKTIAQLVVDSL
jgi:hypothetical protein